MSCIYYTADNKNLIITSILNCRSGPLKMNSSLYQMHKCKLTSLLAVNKAKVKSRDAANI